MGHLSAAVAAVLLVAVGLAAGLLIADDQDAPQVNASELASTLWEGSPATEGTSQPPTCESQSADGIGPWSCTFHTKNRGRLVEADAVVDEDGSVQATVGEKRITACCLTLRD